MVTKEIPQVIQTIYHQLRTLGVTQQRGLMFVYMSDGVTLRVNKGKRNVDISYNAGTDLYDCKVHKIHAKTFEVATKEHEGFYAEDLVKLFDPKMSKLIDPMF